MKYPFIRQLDSKDCGPSCLRMIAKYYGKTISSNTLNQLANLKKSGTSLLDLSVAAQQIGFRTSGFRVTWEQLAARITLPCIISWNQNHFIVVYSIQEKSVIVGDPAQGILRYNKESFLKSWISVLDYSEPMGLVLTLDPQPLFYEYQEPNQGKTPRLSGLFRFVRPYWRYLAIILVLVFLSGFLSLLFPSLTSINVDIGIEGKNTKFIKMVLFAQLMLAVGQATTDIVKNWLLVHISARVNLSLVSEFLGKLMRLPIGFFGSKSIGDLLQRIGDFSRIQHFLTIVIISAITATVSFIAYGFILSSYSLPILFVFLFGSIFFVGWTLLFLKWRKKLDYIRFQESAKNQSTVIQLITGMQEIKLNNCEDKRQSEWEQIQAKLYQITLKGLNLAQTQQMGGLFIDQSKNIIISFLSAQAVISGDMSFGVMLALQFIVGQMNAPVSQFVSLIQSTQDAKISFDRLNDIQRIPDEESSHGGGVIQRDLSKSITIDNLSFQYNGPKSLFALNKVSLEIPQNKVTAIVGASGSGKTTLIKMILGFYPPVDGVIRIGDTDLSSISPAYWRSKCGVVMQDGFIFTDTIANNIAAGGDIIDMERVLRVAQKACIHDFIQSLPMGYNTIIGNDGNGISAGQKQRILIARALYKDADYIILDEATNALDAENEFSIMNNLSTSFEGKTVLIVAHRLSTVRKADRIYVMNGGRIIEEGTHQSLVEKHGYYYKLVEDQLNLGK